MLEWGIGSRHPICSKGYTIAMIVQMKVMLGESSYRSSKRIFILGPVLPNFRDKIDPNELLVAWLLIDPNLFF